MQPRSLTVVQGIEIVDRFLVGSSPSNGRLRLPFTLDGRDRIRESSAEPRVFTSHRVSLIGLLAPKSGSARGGS